MLKPWEFWSLTGAGALTIALVLYNITQYSGNRELQLRLTQDNQYIQQSAQLQALNNEIIKALAQLAQRDQDAAVRDLLARNGVTFQPAAPPPPDAAAKPAAPSR